MIHFKLCIIRFFRKCLPKCRVKTNVCAVDLSSMKNQHIKRAGKFSYSVLTCTWTATKINLYQVYFILKYTWQWYYTMLWYYCQVYFYTLIKWRCKHMKICVVFADGSSIEYTADKINSKWFSRKVSRWCKRNNTRVISKTKTAK